MKKADDEKARQAEQRKQQAVLLLPQKRDMQAHLKLRHYMVMLSFLVFFVAPTAAWNYYMHVMAADEYASYAAFSVRSREAPVTRDFLSQLISPMDSDARDIDILYDYMLSPQIVERVNERIDLRKIWSLPEGDPLARLDPNATSEELVSYWRRRVNLTYEQRLGSLGIEVTSFTPQDAYVVNELIINEALDLSNELSGAARDDLVRFARIDLQEAADRLERERQRMRDFRLENNLIAPDIEAEQQFTVLTTLQQAMADEIVNRATLLETTRENDPRLAASDRRITAIGEQIAAERRRLGSADDETGDIAGQLQTFEALQTDIEFAGQAYLSAQSSYLDARIQARRQNRYLAVHVQPTMPETAAYPLRWTNGVLISCFIFVAWLTGVLVFYNIRDRR